MDCAQDGPEGHRVRPTKIFHRKHRMNPLSPQPIKHFAPKGYWLVMAAVTDPTQFLKYVAVAGPLLASYGGRVLARGDVSTVVEGAIPKRPYFVEFPNYADALACFHCEGYQEAITLRAGAASFDIVVVEGLPPAA